MVVSVQFKNSKKVFGGRIYEYRLHSEEDIPKCGSVIRMMDKDYNYICNGTRVKVADIREENFSDMTNLSVIRYVKSSMEE